MEAAGRRRGGVPRSEKPPASRIRRAWRRSVRHAECAIPRGAARSRPQFGGTPHGARATKGVGRAPPAPRPALANAAAHDVPLLIAVSISTTLSRRGPGSNERLGRPPLAEAQHRAARAWGCRAHLVPHAQAPRRATSPHAWPSRRAVVGGRRAAIGPREHVQRARARGLAATSVRPEIEPGSRNAHAVTRRRSISRCGAPRAPRRAPHVADLPRHHRRSALARAGGAPARRGGDRRRGLGCAPALQPRSCRSTHWEPGPTWSSRAPTSTSAVSAAQRCCTSRTARRAGSRSTRSTVRSAHLEHEPEQPAARLARCGARPGRAEGARLLAEAGPHPRGPARRHRRGPGLRAARRRADRPHGIAGIDPLRLCIDVRGTGGRARPRAPGACRPRPGARARAARDDRGLLRARRIAG